MGIALGNLSIKELEKRTGWVFSNEDYKWLEDHRQDLANIDSNKEEFHIFDIPFEIMVSALIKTKLIDILTKYNNENTSKEPLQIAVRSETEQEKINRENKEKEEKDRQEKFENPNSIWLVKWHMLVPVKVIYNNKLIDLYYNCFINTYITGRNNIPDFIEGNAWIEKNEEGLHGKYNLINPEKDNDDNINLKWNWVVGTGFVDLHGNYVGTGDTFTFERVDFSINEAIKLYKNIKDNNYKGIYFDRFAK